MMEKPTIVQDGFENEDDIYDSILQEFREDEVNEMSVAFLMMDVAKRGEVIVSYNGLMLLNGLLHKNEPVCAFGTDSRELKDCKREEYEKKIEILLKSFKPRSG